MQLQIIQGDITKIQAEAIVNAAHPTLLGGSGVDGAVHRAAGKELLKECMKIRAEQYKEGLPVGEAVVTKAYGLEKDGVKLIIHTTGPRYFRGNPEKLRNCYINSLKLAEEHNCKSIVFPAISTGAFGMPMEYSIKVVKEVMDNYEFNEIERVILCFRAEEDKVIAEKAFGKGACQNENKK
jgi:O-acetyl-ADP-ribose deacetylase (regulator of RNase III)